MAGKIKAAQYCVPCVVIILAAGLLSASAANAITFTQSVDSIALSEGGVSSITYMFTNDLSQNVYIAHVDVVRMNSQGACAADCINPIVYHDPTERLVPAGTSYQFTVPVVSVNDGGTTTEDADVGANTVKASLYWEFNMRGLGKQKLIKTVSVSISDPVSSAQALRPLAQVPEPAAWTLMALGFAGLGAAIRASRAANPAI